MAEAEAALLACLQEISPHAETSPFPPSENPAPNRWRGHIGASELMTLYDSMGRTSDADRYRLRAAQAHAYRDSLVTAGRVLAD